MTRRMFVALYPPDRVVAQLSAALEQVKSHHDRADSVRWSDPGQWHLTLAFMPKVAEENLPRLATALAQVAEGAGAGPHLAVSGGGRFGATTLWWALGGDVGAERWLQQLSRSVRRGCRAAGVPPDDSRWRPHITVGRVHRDAPADTARVWAQALAGITSQAWQPQDVVLVDSVTGPAVRHTVIDRWPLKPAA